MEYSIDLPSVRTAQEDPHAYLVGTINQEVAWLLISTPI